MKLPKFHIGQMVTPVEADVLMNEACTLKLKMGAVYEVNFLEYSEGIPDIMAAGWYIGCVEWPQNDMALETNFAPVQELPDEALAQLIEESFTVTA